MTLLPTPTVADSRDTANYQPDGTPYGSGCGMTLTDSARLLLPTPMAADGDRSSMSFAGGNPTLLGAITPARSRGGRRRQAAPPLGQLMLGDG